MGGVESRSKHLIYAIQGRVTGSVLDFFYAFGEK